MELRQRRPDRQMSSTQRRWAVQTSDIDMPGTIHGEQSCIAQHQWLNEQRLAMMHSRHGSMRSQAIYCVFVSIAIVAAAAQVAAVVPGPPLQSRMSAAGARITPSCTAWHAEACRDCTIGAWTGRRMCGRCQAALQRCVLRCNHDREHWGRGTQRWRRATAGTHLEQAPSCAEPRPQS